MQVACSRRHMSILLFVLSAVLDLEVTKFLSRILVFGTESSKKFDAHLKVFVIACRCHKMAAKHILFRLRQGRTKSAGSFLGPRRQDGVAAIFLFLVWFSSEDEFRPKMMITILPHLDMSKIIKAGN